MRVPAAAFSAFTLALSFTARAAPFLNFPISSQVPPVALVDQQYSFTFERSTFVSSKGPISYALRNQPSWLRLNAATRTLFGVARAVNPGPFTFDLIATDATSVSAALEVTLYIMDHAGPQPAAGILPQLRQAGQVSAPSTLLLQPFESFNIDFDHSTFLNVADSTIFYATSADNSPLPAWTNFDPDKLVLWGRGVPLVSNSARPQEFGLKLIATNVPGFAQATVHFQLVVSHHVLAFSEAYHRVEVSPGRAFKSKPLRQHLFLDDTIIDDSHLVSLIAEVPNWAELDTSDILLRGRPTEDAKSQTVVIQATDVHGNVANASISLSVMDSRESLFATSLPSANASIGQVFRYTLPANAVSQAGVQLTAEVSNASAWMTYDASSKTLRGVVPENVEPGVITITFVAHMGDTTEREQVRLNIVKPTASAESSNRPHEQPTATDQPGLQPASHAEPATEGQTRKLAVILATTLPVACLLCFGVIMLCCHLGRKRRSRSSIRSSYNRSSHSDHHHHQEVKENTFPESGGNTSPPDLERPVSAPRIELSWATDSLKLSRARASKLEANRQTAVSSLDWGSLDIDDGTRSPEQAARPKASNEEEPDALEELAGSEDWTPFVRSSSAYFNLSRRRTTPRSSQARVRKLSASSHASKSLRTLSTMSMGLPVRLSGAGHGAGGPGILELAPPHYSWRNMIECGVNQDGRGKNLDLSNFPDPPSSSINKGGSRADRRIKSTIRLVTDDGGTSETLSEQRQQWIRDRARQRNGCVLGSSDSRASLRRANNRFADSRTSLRNRARLQMLNGGGSPICRPQNSSWLQSSNTAALNLDEQGVSRESSELYDNERRRSNFRQALTTASSGRLNSMGSKSNSSWLDDLIEEVDIEGRRRWVAVDKASHESTAFSSSSPPEANDSEQGSHDKRSRPPGLKAFTEHVQSNHQRMGPGERRWRLGSGQARRPVSIDDGELQKSLGSQRGNLAFI